MSRALARKIERLMRQLAQYEERLDALQDNYEALSEQLNFTSNAADRKNLDRQLTSLEDEIEAVEARYVEAENALQAAKAQQDDGGVATLNPEVPASNPSGVDILLDLLQPDESSLIALAHQAFQFCRPEGWVRPEPDTLKGILLELEDMPARDPRFSALLEFVAYLLISPQLPSNVQAPLNTWANQQTPDFVTLKTYVEQAILVEDEAVEQAQSYLLIWVKASQVKARQYWVEARLIPDARVYDSRTGAGSISLCNCLPHQETFTQEDFEALAIGYLEQCKSYRLSFLTIEVFLPLPLLNQAVDAWKRQEYGLPPVPIGCDYRVVVRSSERLKNYGYWGQWEAKWQTLKQQVHQPATQLCDDGDCPLGELLFKLSQPEAVAVKLTKAPQKAGEGSIFAALLKTATPVALWVRRNLAILPDQVSELDHLLECCIHELPTRVKDKRCETLLPGNQAVDNHIGHHLALLWEDPHRLPPTDIEYMSPSL